MACGWCGGPITLRSRGPIPKWCSATCRHRAWEQARAAASGRAALQIVERIVVTPPVKAVLATPQHDDWIGLLEELSLQLDRGIVYDRDLPGLTRAFEEARAAFQRRLRHR
jgi:glyoxylase-like metal-dependent hydrolase (beta-lactamase superfamily II)